MPGGRRIRRSRGVNQVFILAEASQSDPDLLRCAQLAQQFRRFVGELTWLGPRPRESALPAEAETANWEFDEINADFVMQPMNWSRVRGGARSFLVYGSDNDPYVPLERVEHIARKLGVPPLVIQHGGHLNAESGFTSLSPLLIGLEQLLMRPDEPSQPITHT
jgi:hypothetical protein